MKVAHEFVNLDTLWSLEYNSKTGNVLLIKMLFVLLTVHFMLIFLLDPKAGEY